MFTHTKTYKYSIFMVAPFVIPNTGNKPNVLQHKNK
jgi:hypothetical protein